VYPIRRGAGLATEQGAALRKKYSPPQRDRRYKVLTDREVRRQAHLGLRPLLTSALAYPFSLRVRRDTADLILRAAARRSSVTRARAHSRRGTSGRHSRRLLAHLDPGRTQRAVTRALREQTRLFLPNRPADVAIDFHDVPYYGQAIDPDHPQFVKTPESRGTHRAYPYATLDLLLPNFRFTVALRYLRERGHRQRTVARMLAEAPRAGVQIRRLYLDREFYEYETLSWLKAEGYTVITPMRLGSRQRKRWERGQRSYITEHTLRDPKGRGAPLSLRVHVVVRYQKGKKWNRRGAQYLVYEGIGHVAEETLRAVPLRQTHTLYRTRFGIETSYRLLGEARPITTSRSPAVRLLYVGVALLLQNEWVIRKLQYASEGRQGPTGFVVHEERLRFSTLLELLLYAVIRRLGGIPEIRRENRPPASAPLDGDRSDVRSMGRWPSTGVGL
jgi:putative transposase